MGDHMKPLQGVHELRYFANAHPSGGPRCSPVSTPLVAPNCETNHRDSRYQAPTRSNPPLRAHCHQDTHPATRLQAKRLEICLIRPPGFRDVVPVRLARPSIDRPKNVEQNRD
jgi:hypothetical protein